MLATIATLRDKDRFRSLFYAVAMELAAAVNANEEGCLSYEIFHGEKPQTFIFIERCRDEAETESQRNSKHFKTIGARMGPFVARRLEVDQMDGA